MRRILNRVETLTGRALGRLPARVQLGLAGGRPIRMDGRTLAPDVQVILRLRALLVREALEPTPAEARRSTRRQTLLHGGPPIAVGSVRDLTVAGRLPARHYAPDTEERAPLLVYLHGGGFVTGDLDTHDAPCRFLCRHAGVHVLAIDYRVAPEHPFPAAVDDARDAFWWARANAAALGADPARVAIGGDSAGGNLSAVTAQLLRDAPPALQLLIYPAVDLSVEHPTVERLKEGFLLGRADIRWFRRHYTGDVPETRADPRVSPLLARDLSGHWAHVIPSPSWASRARAPSFS